jgi:hypothetical protein
MTDAATPALDQAQLQAVLELLPDVDSAELKLTVPDTLHRSAVARLGLDPLEAQIRQVFFFDTPDLALDRHGVVVRARRVQGREHDTVVKLRPVEPATLSAELRKSAAFFVEVDAMPGGFVCSASCKGRVKDPDSIREVVAGRMAARKLFSKEQRRFYEANAPAGISLDDLSVLGPIFVLKLKFAPEKIKRRLVAELWLYPDGARVMELSTKCLPNEAFQAAAELRSFLGGLELYTTDAQQTKTRTALEFYGRELAAEQG